MVAMVVLALGLHAAVFVLLEHDRKASPVVRDAITVTLVAAPPRAEPQMEVPPKPEIQPAAKPVARPEPREARKAAPQPAKPKPPVMPKSDNAKSEEPAPEIPDVPTRAGAFEPSAMAPEPQETPPETRQSAPQSAPQAAPQPALMRPAFHRVSQASAPVPPVTPMGERHKTLLIEWGGKVRGKILRVKRYPKGMRGSADVRLNLSVAPSGDLVAVTIAHSSGRPAFDRAALDAVRRAGRFPRAPQLLTAPSYRFTLTMNFD